MPKPTRKTQFFSKVLVLFEVLSRYYFSIAGGIFNFPSQKEHRHRIAIAAALLPPPPPCCRHHCRRRWRPCPLSSPLSLRSPAPAPSAAVAFIYIVIVIVSSLPFLLPLQLLLLVDPFLFPIRYLVTKSDLRCFVALAGMLPALRTYL